MKLRVKLFAILKHVAGEDELDVELPAGSTIEDLRGAIAEARPDLAAIMPSVLFAVNSEYATGQTVVEPGKEIACIPPVSGG